MSHDSQRRTSQLGRGRGRRCGRRCGSVPSVQFVLAVPATELSAAPLRGPRCRRRQAEDEEHAPLCAGGRAAAAGFGYFAG